MLRPGTFHPQTLFGRNGFMKCRCGYSGQEGWDEAVINQDFQGNDERAWFCPECGTEICSEDADCPSFDED